MNAQEICTELGASAEQLAEWRKLGLPHGGTKRKPIFDAAAVADWLVERGLYKRPLGVVTRLRDVADHFGVSSRAVGYWKDRGMPWEAGRYDLDKIATWRESQQGSDDEQQEDTRGYWETRRSRAAALQAELDLQAKRGELIEVDTAARLVGQHVAAVKSQLEQLPDYVLSLVTLTAAVKRTVRDRLRTKIRDLCEAFERSLHELAEASAGGEEANE